MITLLPPPLFSTNCNDESMNKGLIGSSSRAISIFETFILKGMTTLLIIRFWPWEYHIKTVLLNSILKNQVSIFLSAFYYRVNENKNLFYINCTAAHLKFLGTKYKNLRKIIIKGSTLLTLWKYLGDFKNMYLSNYLY